MTKREFEARRAALLAKAAQDQPREAQGRPPAPSEGVGSPQADAAA